MRRELFHLYGILQVTILLSKDIQTITSMLILMLLEQMFFSIISFLFLILLHVTCILHTVILLMFCRINTNQEMFIIKNIDLLSSYSHIATYKLNLCSING